MFDDPILTSLVERAMAANLDLKLAGSRIRQARAARLAAGAGGGPAADLSGSYRRNKAAAGDQAGDLYLAGFDAGWELDFFGKNRRAVEAAGAELQSLIEARRQTQVILTAEVAAAYVELRGGQARLALAKGDQVAQGRRVELVRRRFEAGLASELDVAAARAQEAAAAAQVPPLATAIRQSLHRLALLLAAPPAVLVEELSAAAPIPTPTRSIPAGLPSDLLRRRPDIRRAEADIHGATARIGVAAAELFPAFTLSGTFGLQASEFGKVANWPNRFWTVGPTLNWNLFDMGRVRAGIETMRAAQEQALIGYQQAVLAALAEVENALVATVRAAEHRRALSELVAARRNALDLAIRLYRNGQTEFLPVLDAQRFLSTAEQSMAQSSQQLATDLIALCKALGGGWEATAADADRKGDGGRGEGGRGE